LKRSIGKIWMAVKQKGEEEKIWLARFSEEIASI
jgi:hypothetical protein